MQPGHHLHFLSLCSHPLAASPEESRRGLRPVLVTNVHLIQTTCIAQITLLFTLSVEVVKENYLFRSGIQSYMTETPTEEFFIASIKCFYSLFSPARTANSCFFNSDLHPFVFFHFSVSLQQLVSGFFLAIKCSLSPSDLEKQLS